MIRRMMWLTAFCVGLPLLFPPKAHAGPVNAWVYVEGTGHDSEINEDPDLYQRTTSFSDESVPFYFSDVITSYNDVGRVRSYTSEAAAWSSSPGVIAASAYGYGEGGGNLSAWGSGTSKTVWSDHIDLVWSGDGAEPSLPSSDLVFSYFTSGHLDVHASTAGSGSSTSRATLLATGYGPTHVYEELYLYWVGEGPQSKTLDVTGIQFEDVVSYDQWGADFSFRVETEAESNLGYANSSASLVLESITFLDGTTPESQGWDIAFESGIESPNIASASPVPEPSTIALLSIGLLGIGGYASRKRRLFCSMTSNVERG